MTSPAPIDIQAEVDPRERVALQFAAQQLAEALRLATGSQWPIRLTFWDPGTLAAAGPQSVVVLSLLTEIQNEAPLADIAARWRGRVERLAADGANVLVLTVFRAVSERRTQSGQRLLDRIRRLNRMVLDLSHDVGVTVVDIDRALAHIGARTLKTDYRLTSRLAADVAGHTFALSLLSLGLDDTIPVHVQEQARARHGTLGDLEALVHRRAGGE